MPYIILDFDGVLARTIDEDLDILQILEPKDLPRNELRKKLLNISVSLGMVWKTIYQKKKSAKK